MKKCLFLLLILSSCASNKPKKNPTHCEVDDKSGELVCTAVSEEIIHVVPKK